MKHKRLLFTCILAACTALATGAWAQQNPPTDVQAARGDAMAAVSFQAPTAESGTTISGYTVTAYTSDGTTLTAVTTQAGTASPIIVHGLSNGTVYTFKVTATNSSDHQGASSTSNFVKPVASGYKVYAGTWNVTSMVTGADSPDGERCVQTLDPSGALSMSCTDINGGTTQYPDCHAWLFPYGMTITCDSEYIPAHFLCYLNSASTTGTPGSAPTTVGTVMACTGTINDANGSSDVLSVGVRQGSSYSTSDIFNTSWYGEHLGVKSDGSAFWEQEVDPPISIDGTGTSTDTATYSYKSPVTYTNSISLGSTWPTTGMLTVCPSGDCSGDTLNLYMDAGKSVVVGFTAIPPWAELGVLSKKASSYTSSDLAGYWAGNELNSDGTWQRFLLQINPGGSFIMSSLDSDGTPSAAAGILAISSDGKVTCDTGACSDQSFTLVMDSSKTVMTGTSTHSSGSGSISYRMFIFTKTKSPWANGVDLGAGWMWLRSYGYLYTGDAPWIYWGSTHGWLYPFVDTSGSNWFWDGNMGAFWWTNQGLYPYLLRADNNHWLWYKDTVSGSRTFIDLSNGNNKLYYNMN